MSTNKYSKYVVENVVTGTQIRSIVPAGALDSAAVIDLIDSDYVAARSPAANGFDSADVIGIVDSDYVQSRVTLDGVGIDSATAQSIANSEILSTVDSAYVQARVTLDGVGLDSAGVTALVDSDYVAARAPAASGGLDSAGVQLLIDAEVQDPTTLTLGASSNAGIGIGSGVVTNGLSGGSVSIGTNANSYLQSVAIGSGANASGTGSVSVGPNTQASGNFNTAIGREATTSGSNSLALGYSSSAGNYGIALGDAASGQRSIAIGALASATNNGALHINANYNSGVGPTADGGLVIETSAARLEYSAASDWAFDATVNAPAFVGDGSGLTNLPAGGGLEGFDVSQYDSATSNGIFEYNVSGGGQKQLLFSLNTAVAPIPRSDATLDNQVNYTLSTNHQFGFKDAGGFRTEVYGRAAGTTASTGLVLTGPTFNNSGVELVGNLKLSSLPTSDPSEAGLLWNDGGIPVFSGSTAPTGGGGLDSAGVTALINEPYLRDTLYDVAAAQTNIGLDAGFASTSNFSIAIGKESGINSGNATNSIAIGFKAGQNISDNSIMIGRQTAEFSPVSFAVGIGTEALQNTAGNGAVAVGYRAGQNNSGDNSVAVGINAEATADYAVSIGDNATVSNPAVIGIAIGRNTSVTTPGGVGGVAIGSGASVSDNDTLAIGRNTVASAADATAIGPNTTASGRRSIAIGNNVTAITDDAVTIGSSVAGRVTYDTTNDWTFGAGVTMTDLTASGVVIFSALPTSDPVNAGQLWNDAGTLKVSAG